MSWPAFDQHRDRLPTERGAPPAARAQRRSDLLRVREAADPERVDVAIVGAGPYGLSLAAHLAARSVRFRIFGRVMETWRANMPPGLFLKSGGHASNIPAPDAPDTITGFCAKHEGRAIDRASVIPAELFIRYGDWFQKKYVPSLESDYVTACTRLSDHFLLRLEEGPPVRAKSVVVATGYSNSAHLPDQLAGLPSRLASHSSEHGPLEPFKGRRVVVLGAGQSALEMAALLNEAGARPTILARRDSLSWGGRADSNPSLYARLRAPMTPLGAGWKYVFFTLREAPFFHLPGGLRRTIAEQALGPLGSWWVRDRVVGRVPMMLGWMVEDATARTDGVVLHLRRGHERGDIEADHVIAATGYHVAPSSFPFLSPDLKRAMRWEFNAPALSKNFESNVPGLHFIGLAATYRFGPAMRFLAGAATAAPRVSSLLAARLASA